VARAIADGIRETSDVEVAEITANTPPPDGDISLVVAGGPTHVFSMSRTRTREDAVKNGAHPASAAFGLREWMASLPSGSHKEALATFDTRVNKARAMTGSAARGAAKVARRHGYDAVRTESFFVADMNGPLLEGELDRARAWGQQLVASVVAGVRPGGAS
jgi:hypothetical protein